MDIFIKLRNKIEILVDEKVIFLENEKWMEGC